VKLAYSAQAVADLKRLRAFIAEHDPNTAERIAERLLYQLDHLRRSPRMGHPVPLAPDPESVRDVVFGDYIIRYSIHPRLVMILKIWHQLENRSGAPTDR